MSTLTLRVSATLPSGQTEDDRSSDLKMKSHARHKSHEVAGADDRVGPVCRFLLRGDRITERRLSKREIIFGVPAPRDGKDGGWKGLVSWIWHDEPEHPELRIDMARARAIGAESWIVDFVGAAVKECGWTVVDLWASLSMARPRSSESCS